MELKLTNEEKAKVFAMYFGVPCVRYKGWDTGIFQEVYETSISILQRQNTEWNLALTPLSSITDEHAIEVYTLNTNYPEFHNDIEDKIYNAKEWLIAPEFPIAWDCYQYLISKGYDVPLWFGVNHWVNGKTAIELGIAIDKTEIS